MPWEYMKENRPVARVTTGKRTLDTFVNWGSSEDLREFFCMCFFSLCRVVPEDPRAACCRNAWRPTAAHSLDPSTVSLENR